VRRDVTPGFVAAELIVWLHEHKIIRPGYTTLQELVSEALSAERRRLGGLLAEVLDESAKGMLGQLPVRDDTLSQLAALRQDAKDFGWRQMAREREKRATLGPLHEIAKALLPSWASRSNHAFLSHNGDDKPAVRDLAAKLEEHGLACWLDEWNLIPGSQQLKRRLANAIPVSFFLALTALAPGTMKKCAWRSSDVSTHASTSSAFYPQSSRAASAPKRASCRAFYKAQPGSSSGGHLTRRMPSTGWRVASKVSHLDVGLETPS
jgi:hypothetical protein